MICENGRRKMCYVVEAAAKSLSCESGVYRSKKNKLIAL
jgi:hypothetical protein